MNVVTVGYLAVLRDVGDVAGGSDAAAAALIPVSAVLNGKIELAFDHLQIVRDAVERVGVELDVKGIAPAFVGETFTLAELRTVYEAVWGVQLDAANFRRSIVQEDGWVIPTGRRAQPGPSGGRPAELYRAGRAWSHGGPIHRQAGGERGEARCGPSCTTDTDRRRSCASRTSSRPSPRTTRCSCASRATTVNQTDCHMRRARPFPWRFMLGLRRPKRRILGSEFAGEVEAVGSAVTDFQVGDRVFGIRSGAHAEYLCVKATRLVAQIPAGMTFEDAAAVCDGAYQGLSCLRGAGVHEGQSVLVYGASGSCGTACVQLAHYYGAHVTAVCNTKNVDLVRSLGADEVIDYLQEDFTKNGKQYDALIDAVGKRRSFRQNRRSLKPGGVFVADRRPPQHRARSAGVALGKKTDAIR